MNILYYEPFTTFERWNNTRKLSTFSGYYYGVRILIKSVSDLPLVGGYVWP